MTESGDTLLLSKIKTTVNQLQRKFINHQLKSRLKNHGMTVISANCVGAFVLHDLGEPFNSPFVNLYLSPKNFIRYLQNIDFYQQQSLEFISSKKTTQSVNWQILKFISCIIVMSKKQEKNGKPALLGSIRIIYLS